MELLSKIVNIPGARLTPSFHYYVMEIGCPGRSTGAKTSPLASGWGGLAARIKGSALVFWLRLVLFSVLLQYVVMWYHCCREYPPSCEGEGESFLLDTQQCGEEES